MPFKLFFVLGFLCVALPTTAQKDYIEFNGGYKGSLYTYTDYLNDQYLEHRLFFELSRDNYDTLAVLLPRYKNRLGYNYFLLMAGFLHMENDPYALNYLDSAFQRGAAPVCVQRYMHGFKEDVLQQRFLKNTMRGYNNAIIAKTDSLLLQDDLYRKEIRKIADFKPATALSYVGDMPNQSVLNKLDGNKKHKIDSLMALQSAIDKTDMQELARMGEEGIFPRAAAVGIEYCYRNAPDPFQIYAHHNSNSKHAIIGVPLLKHLMRLCSHQTEDWGRVEKFLQSIYYRDFPDFREFYYLKFTNGDVDKFESALALNQMVMAKVLRTDAKLELSCSNSAVFEQLRDLMLYFSKFVVNEAVLSALETKQATLPEKIKKEDIVFVPNSSLPPDKVEFRFVLHSLKGK